MIDIGLTTLEKLIINIAINCAIGGFVVIIFMYFFIMKLYKRILILENRFK